MEPPTRRTAGKDRLRRTRAAQAQFDAFVRLSVATETERAIEKEVKSMKAKWEADKHAEVMRLQSLHEQAMVSLGHGHRCAAQQMRSAAKTAEGQMKAWHSAADTALDRGSKALATDLAARREAEAMAPGRRYKHATEAYNVWGQVPADIKLQLRSTKARRARLVRARRRRPQRTPTPYNLATTEDPTQPTFNAVKAAEEAKASRAARTAAAAAKLTEEREVAHRRGSKATRMVRQSTDARSILAELKRLKEADRRVRGVRSVAWEPPPDTRDAVRRRAKDEANLERAFENLMFAS